MSWRRVSLLTKSTRVPGATVYSLGLTPAAVMVKVFGLDGAGVGVVADDPPHDTSTTDAATAAARIPMALDYAIAAERRLRLDAESYWMTIVPWSAAFSGFRWSWKP